MVAGRDPVVRELGRRHRHAADLTASLELLAERCVEAIALAVEELALGDLGRGAHVAEGVPAELRRPAPGIDEHAMGQRGSQRIADRRHRRVEDRPRAAPRRPAGLR